MQTVKQILEKVTSGELKLSSKLVEELQKLAPGDVVGIEESTGQLYIIPPSKQNLDVLANNISNDSPKTLLNE